MICRAISPTVSRRSALMTMAALILTAPAVHAAATATGEDAFDAIVRTTPGPGEEAARVHVSLGAALAAAPMDGDRPFRILVGRGVWDGQVVIDRPNIHLVGEVRDASVISHRAASGLTAPDGQPFGLSRTPTLIVRAPGFRAERLTIRNAFDGLAEMVRPNGLRSHDGAGPQAVALLLAAGSDRAVLRGCDIMGYQDTLFADAGSALFERCLITGSYDFIFGAGQAWFEHCEIRSRERPVDPVEGYVVAPSTASEHPFGFVFHRCRLTKEDGVPEGSVFLGRPWRPSRTFPDGRYGDPAAVAAAAFLECWMDDHIAADGWTQMWSRGRDGQTQVMVQPETVRFATWRSTGPGAAAFGRGKVLSDDEAARILSDAVPSGR